MGYIDGIIANTFRTDSHGQLVFALFRCAYLVPAERARALLTFLRRYYLLIFIALPTAVLISRSLLIVFVVAVLWLAGLYLKVWHFTRGLASAPELPPLDRQQAINRSMAAMGTRTIAAVAIIFALAGVGGGALLATGTWNVPLLGLTVYSFLVTILYTIRWRQAMRRDPPTTPDAS